MGKSYFIVLSVISLVFVQRCSVAYAIECFECGILSILPQENNVTMSGWSDCSYINPTFVSEIDTCSYNLDVKYTTGVLQTTLELTHNESLQAVCYSLWGTFRGERIVMRGCDALPISNIDPTGDHCLDSNFKVWFETEAGKEYITNHVLCACNDEDFCNFHPSSSRTVLTRSSVIMVLIFLLIFCFNLL